MKAKEPTFDEEEKDKKKEFVEFLETTFKEEVEKIKEVRKAQFLAFKDLE